MKKITACFSGHRKIPPEQYEMIARRLKRETTKLIEKGYLYFGAGGALGFDTLAAQTILNLKKDYPQIKLILVLPCLSQADSWDEDDRAIYEETKSKADKVVYTSRDYTRGCMHKRNRHLIDCSSTCVCFLKESFGGTAYTVKYAIQNGLDVINVAEK